MDALTPEQQQDLLKKVEQLTQTVEEQKQYIEDASILSLAINKDPALKETVVNHIKGLANNPNPQPPAPPAPPTPPTEHPDWKFDPATGKPYDAKQTPPPAPPAPPTPPVDTRIDQLDARERQQIVERVEAKLGKNTLKDEDKKAFRTKVAKRMENQGRNFMSTPVHILESVLQDAYVMEDLSSLNPETDKEKIDSLIAARNNDLGAFPTLGTTTPPKDTTAITPEQKKWSDHLGVPQDKVVANLKELTETGKVTYKPKEPDVKITPPSPSPNPTPPTL